jgi:redox-sensitive bicupin YhaK (pirin superfamily)
MKTIRRIIRDVQPHWVGDGFPVRSLFSYSDGAEFDPFLLLDYAGPYEFAPAEATRGVGEHPHRGFETVTIVYQGELDHSDSSGGHGSIAAGDVQWMTAASGVVHEEFHSQRFTEAGGTLEMVQLWVNLPAKDKMTQPRYQGILNSQIPQVELPNGAGTVRVIAGECLGSLGPAKTFTPINVWDLQLSSSGETELTVPDGHTAMLVVQSGELLINSTPVKTAELALLDRQGSRIHLHAQSASRALLLTGETLNEPVVGQGPFVMNTREQILEAFQDYRAGRMGRMV